jgi:hypothetical protein
MQTSPTAAATPEQMAAMQQQLRLEARFKSGVGWFYWIAGMSVVNTIAFLSGSSWTFAVGLGAAQVVDGLAAAIAPSFDETTGNVIRAVAFLIDLALAGLFLGLGVLARRRQRWAIVVGLALYLLDAGILLLFGDWLGLLIHGLGLFGLFSGLRALNELMKLEPAPPASLPTTGLPSA